MSAQLATIDYKKLYGCRQPISDTRGPGLYPLRLTGCICIISTIMRTVSRSKPPLLSMCENMQNAQRRRPVGTFLPTHQRSAVMTLQKPKPPSPGRNFYEIYTACQLCSHPHATNLVNTTEQLTPLKKATHLGHPLRLTCVISL